jgi:hypothetical protein
VWPEAHESHPAPILAVVEADGCRTCFCGPWGLACGSSVACGQSTQVRGGTLLAFGCPEVSCGPRGFGQVWDLGSHCLGVLISVRVFPSHPPQGSVLRTVKPRLTVPSELMQTPIPLTITLFPIRSRCHCLPPDFSCSLLCFTSPAGKKTRSGLVWDMAPLPTSRMSFIHPIIVILSFPT